MNRAVKGKGNLSVFFSLLTEGGRCRVAAGVASGLTSHGPNRISAFPEHSPAQRVIDLSPQHAIRHSPFATLPLFPFASRRAQVIFRARMTRRTWLAAAALFLVHAAFAQPNEIRKSLCRINNTAQEFNYRVPWLPGGMSGGSGTGWVVKKDRLMTNAHVVSNAKLLTVEKENDPKKYVATVEFIAHDCDLALLKVEDPGFWKDTKPLALGSVPEIESSVSVYGYPIGGQRMSVTKGIVSRIDFLTYSHSVMDSHLCIQIDAAINPGNSGGPVLQGGKVVGVAFQGYSGDVAQNVGYMIPTPVIGHFLKDIEDGQIGRAHV